MAANESDREDLMREAVALPERTELRVAGFDRLITIGFRVNLWMSVFIGQDPVYQFDADGRLRRGFVNGVLFRSQHQTLARLERIRTSGQTQLLRHDLNTDELAAFRSTMNELLLVVAKQIREGRCDVVRVVPETSDLRIRIVAALDAVANAEYWLSPEIRKRQ